jgi:DNA-binding beta-propeller fold protein YncE
VKDAYDLGRSWSGLIKVDELVDFVPMLIWWLLLTWLAYSVAGEKMPWLSTHFVIPMALLSGWYLNETFAGHRLTSRRFLGFVGLLVVFLGAAFLALKPVFLGQISNTQRLTNLTTIGRFIGMLVIAVAIFYVVRRVGSGMDRPMRRRGWLLAILAALSVLTLRFTYMANWPNADSAREFLVYAHAAPAVKDVVMNQVDTLSQRLFGDKSMKVAWGDDGTWPIQWYLRDYPNRLYAGKNPSANIADYPVVIVGHRDLAAFENFLKDREYLAEDYTFLWWPIEDYRKFSWNALLGLGDVRNEDGSTRTGRGLLSADVRQALWDIFFYRNYEKYSEVFGGTHTASAWPLRADLRLFIRRDVLANLWDYGAGATVIEPPVDPYAAGELALTPDLVIGAGGMSEGQLLRPRNLALGPGGDLYVLDSGNNRVAVFDNQGQLLRQWGSQGTAEGQFNEPWGIAVDDTYVYVADTWNHRVQKFTLDGDFVLAFGESGSVNDLGADSGGFFFGPRSIIMMPEGQLLVTDTGNHRLQLFDRDGNFIRLVGQLGAGPGQFNEPVGLVLSPDGWVYLADTWNARVQRFTLDLAPSLNWPIDGWEGDSTENKPYLAVDSAGRVYATDPENFRVLIFSGEGQYLARFGEPSSGIDGFGLPNGIAIAGDDSVYVVDAANNRVLRFPPITLGASAPAGDEPGEASGGDGAGSPADEGGGALPTAADGDG